MKQRIISLLILSALIITLLPLIVLFGNAAEESGECGDALRWRFDKDSGTLTISGTGEMYDFGSYWTGKSSAPFFIMHEEIKTLVIDSRVSTIGENAFEGCENLFSATIPESVTKIGDSAFGYCKNLAEISIPDSVTVIGSHAFEYCTGLPDITIPDGVSRINPWSFKGCSSLSVVTLGRSVNSVGVMAFTDCDRLKAIFFKGDRPALDYSEVGVFQDSITLFYLENMVGWAEWPSHEYEGNPIEIWKPDLHIHSYSAKIVGYICVEQCHTVYTCGCGDSFNGNYRDAIGHSYGENGLCTRCVVSYPVDDGNLYFQMSTGEILCADDTVTNLIIPAEINNVAVAGIRKDAFYYCQNLTSVTIPNSVTDIGERAFAACYDLTEISVAEDNLQYCSDEYGVLFNKDKSKLIQAPGGILGVYAIPDGVTSIGAEAFNTANLKSVTIPGSVISIGERAFIGSALTGIWVSEDNTNYCSDEYGVLFNKEKSELLQAPGAISGKYAIPSSVKSVGDYSFAYCINLTDVVIPNGVTSIGKSAFDCCNSLTGVVIPESVTMIGNQAFWGCENLHSVTIPDSVTNVGVQAFEFTGCYFDENNWHDGVFYLGHWLLSINNELPAEYKILNGTVGIANHAFFGCDTLISISIPDGVKTIGDWAFYRCDNLTGIIIPNSVTSIGGKAFENCSGLTNVTIGNGMKSIVDEAFRDCINLTSVCYFGDSPEIGKGVFQTKDWATYEDINIPNLTLYYIEGMDGWTTPTWNGYPTATWVHDHSYTQTVTEPTCTEQGYTTHTCTVCGDSYVDSYVSALNHLEVVDAAVPAICTEAGKTEGKHCSICNTVLVAQEEIPALGHKYENGVCVQCGEKDPNEQLTIEFVDVPQKAWYVEAVNYAVRNSLMKGVGNDQFDPEGTMTRAMLVTVLWRYEGEPEAPANTFSDVKAGSWYFDAVSWAAANNIVGGVGNNKFDPDGNITREQMATILYRYCNGKGIDTSKQASLSGFPDAGKVSSYAQTAMQWAVAEKLVNGSDGKLLPQGNATRAQVATILMRFIENIVKE